MERILPVGVFRIPVNYGLSLAEMIAAGNYNWVNDDITAQQFLIAGEGIVEYNVKLFHFDRVISSKKIVEAITSKDTANPWEPGTIEHLLAFGAKYHEEQHKSPIIALGSSCRVSGNRYVPCLCRVDSERLLNLHWWLDDWNVAYRFLAVRKVSGS